jgi:hypothetical protein
MAKIKNLGIVIMNKIVLLIILINNKMGNEHPSFFIQIVNNDIKIICGYIDI